MVVQVGLHGVAAPVSERLLPALRLPPEPVVQLGPGPVGHVGDPPGDPHARLGPGEPVVLVVVVAAEEGRVGPDREQLGLRPGDLVRRGIRRAGEHQGAVDLVGVRHGPLEDAHAAHRPAEDRRPSRHPDLDRQAGLDGDLVAHRHEREPAPPPSPVAGERRGPGRALAPTEDVGRDDEPPVGVERAARPDEPVPPARRQVRLALGADDMAVPGEGVLDEDRVVGPLVEPAPRLVGHLHPRDDPATLEGDVAHLHELAVPDRVALAPCSGHGTGPHRTSGRARGRRRRASRCRRPRRRRRGTSGPIHNGHPACSWNSRLPDPNGRAVSSPGAPHRREGGLPPSKPGLRAGTHDLRPSYGPPPAPNRTRSTRWT